MNLEKKLYKSNKNKIIGGVCGGFGEYFNIDPTLVRLAFVGLCIVAGGGLLAYIIALIIIPDAPAGYDPTAQSAAKSNPNPTATEAPKSSGEQSNSNSNSESESENDSDTPTLI